MSTPLVIVLTAAAVLAVAVAAFLAYDHGWRRPAQRAAGICVCWPTLLGHVHGCPARPGRGDAFGGTLNDIRRLPEAR
jgi:hypothetical protein